MHPSFPASTTVRRRIRLPLRGDGGAARRARVQGPRLELRELRRLSASPHPLHWTRPAAPRTAPFLTRARPLLLRRYGRAADSQEPSTWCGGRCPRRGRAATLALA